jgi:hypothetical protein
VEYAKLIPGYAFKPWQGLLYYLQRVITPRRLRHILGSGLARYIRLRHGILPAKGQGFHAGRLASLQQDGYMPLGEMLSPEKLNQIRLYFHDKPLIGHGNGHHGGNSSGFTIDKTPPSVRMAEYGLQDILDCPHLLELANHPALLKLAGDYIGCKPTISAIGLRWSFPDAGEGSGLQAFHRDCDDWRFIKVFVYLTDVDAGSGPHVYVQGTQLEHCNMRLRTYSDSEIMQAYGANRVVSITGAAGFGFAVNTHGIHKGMLPTQRPRLLLQIQYSLLPVYMYRYRPKVSSLKLPIDNYINRLFLCAPQTHRRRKFHRFFKNSATINIEGQPSK